MVANIKDESLKHFVIKNLIYKRILELGHSASREYQTSLGIIDVVDWSSQLAYEVLHSPISQSEIEKKTRNYLKVASIKDVIFVRTKSFRVYHPVVKWFEIVKELVV